MRRISAKYLYTNDYEAPLMNGYVVLDDNGTVVGIGVSEDPAAEPEYYDGAIVPGFVNAHCHLELSYLKGKFRKGTGMAGFIDQINAMRDTSSMEEKKADIEYWLDTMWNRGVSAMADISNCSDSFEAKSKSPMFTRTFLEVFGTEPEDCDNVMNGVRKLAEVAEGYGIVASPTPHACYTMSPELVTAVSAEDLRKALELKLEECKASGIGIDSITFSGDGEPTLNPQFPEMVDVTIELRDRYYPKSVISVLTNATRICRPEVRKALMKVDNAILKLDASSDRMVEMINQPACDYSVRDIVEDMKLFDGQFIMQTMFLRFPGFDSLEPENLKNWMDIVREVKPREVMAYTLDRPAPAEGLEKVHPDEMKRALQPLIDEGFKVQIKG